MTSKEERIAAIDLAIERGGGILKFCQRLKVSHQAVYAWKRRGWATLDKAIVIEAIFGIPRSDTMSPDLVRALNTPRAGSDLL